MGKILSVNSLHEVDLSTGVQGSFRNMPEQSIGEDNPQVDPSNHPGKSLWGFLKLLAKGTLFLTGSGGSSETPNHLSSTSSEYMMLMQESEKENKL